MRQVGSHGVRDHNALLSSEGLPRQVVFGKELYDSLYLKAAVHAHSILMNHPFVDGNKRTGMIVAAVFLEDNGYRVIAPRGFIAKFALQIIEAHLSIQQIAEWLKKHSKAVKAN